MIEVGVDDPKIKGLADEFREVIDRHEEIPARVIAALDTVKLEYQLKILGLVE